MRATKKNLVIAEDNGQLITWANAPLMDAPLDMPLTLSISRENLAIGRMEHKACAVARSCSERNFAYFSIGVDVAWIGAFQAGKPVRLRYRSGNLPKKFDKTIKEFQATGVFDARHLETDNYILRPPSESQSLESKLASNNAVRSTVTTAKRPNNKKRNVQEFEGRGRLRA